MTVPAMISLKGRTVLITGASSGVGRALAIELGSRSAHVVLLARDVRRLETVADEIESSGGTARVWPVDITHDEALQNFITAFTTKFDRLDFLIHSAGIFRSGPIASASLDDFDNLYRCNVRAPFAITQGCLPALIAARGAVAFINSTAGETTHANVSQYAATKHALKAIADTLRLEIKGQGVRVLNVMLGRTATPMQEEVCRQEGVIYDARKFLQPQDVASAVVNTLALPAGAEVTNLSLRPSQAPAPVLIAARAAEMNEASRWMELQPERSVPPILVPHE